MKTALDHIRHHPPRRRTEPGRVHDARGKAAHRAPARAAAGGRDRGGIPGRQQRRLRAVKAIADTIKGSIVCGLARANDHDVRRAGDALRDAAAGRSIPSLPPRRSHGTQAAYDARAGDRAGGEAVKLAKSYRDDVEFSPEDAGRSETDFLCRILEQVIKAGATTINIRIPSATPCRSSSAHLSARCVSAFRTRTRWSGRCTATTISAWRWPIP